MTVRPIIQSDRERVAQMMHILCPSDAFPYDFKDEHVFVWEREGGTLGGFASVSVRPWVEGSDSEPCPHVEGWYVEPDLRGKGVGAALVKAIETWCAEQGFQELTSDVEMDNETSLAAHKALGFEPTIQLQYFKKKLQKA